MVGYKVYYTASWSISGIKCYPIRQVSVQHGAAISRHSAHEADLVIDQDKRGVFGCERLVRVRWVGRGILLRKRCGCGGQVRRRGYPKAVRIQMARSVGPLSSCRPPMSVSGLGCVKTRRRASAVEQTFVQITVRCAKIRKRVRFQSTLKNQSLRFSIFCVFTQARSIASIRRCRRHVVETALEP